MGRVAELGSFGGTNHLDSVKANDIAAVGIRIAGVASIVFGVVLAFTSTFIYGLWPFPFEDDSSKLRVYEAYGMISGLHYELLVWSGTGVLVGVFLLLLSRRLGLLVARGLDVS